MPLDATLENLLDAPQNDVNDWTVMRGEEIDIQSRQAMEDAQKAVERIYADVGHTASADEMNDLRNRIANGQSLAEIVANTYDDAQRRFVVEDTPESRAEEAAGTRPTYDAQLEQGRSFDPPDVMMEQLVTGAREVADLQDGWQLTSMQQAPMGNSPRTNYGPAHGVYGSGMAMPEAESGSAFPWGLVLIGAAVLVGGYLLLRKKGK